jgi:EAL domain-containing protein (putative c-di-GMP-specific phosphodiesterase class I)
LQASIGIAFTGRGAASPDELLHDADVAMYRTKRDRRRGHRHQTIDLRELHLAERQAGLARDLEGAPDRGELHLAYQPIVDTGDGRLSGLEALLRWTRPSRRAVPPTVFIPFAEQSGQIIELGQWVLEQAWRDRKRWQQQRKEAIAMSVNVSAHQFMSAGFTDTVESVLASDSSDPRLLTLEVTESIFLSDADRALVVLGELKSLGIKLALDDFGTGYSSLSYLKGLPVDTIKVDQSFIANVARDPASRAVLTAIIQLAHSLGMTVVAEGIETAEQHQALTKLGSDSCQGFYFARPLAAPKLERLIKPSSDGTNPQLPPAAATNA